MEYTAEQIAQIKENTRLRYEPLAIAYMEELETRLTNLGKLYQETIRPQIELRDERIKDLEKQLGLDLMNEAEGENGLGDEITLNITDGECNMPSVCWGGCVGYDAVTLYVETPEEAKALFKALLTIKDGEAD